MIIKEKLYTRGFQHNKLIRGKSISNIALKYPNRPLFTSKFQRICPCKKIFSKTCKSSMKSPETLNLH